MNRFEKQMAECLRARATPEQVQAFTKGFLSGLGLAVEMCLAKKGTAMSDECAAMIMGLRNEAMKPADVVHEISDKEEENE